MKFFSILALCAFMALPSLTQAELRKIGGKVVIPASSTATSADLGVRAHTNIQYFVPTQALQGPQSFGPPYSGYGFETPASLGCVYRTVSKRLGGCIPDKTSVVPVGGSKAIAIVEAYDAPTAASDLAAYSTQFGLPAPNFEKVYASGSQPANVPGWELEASMGIEMAHAMAPNAKIILVEAASNSYVDLLQAVAVANQHVTAEGGGQVVMGWGGSEFASQVNLDSSFSTPGIVYVAAAGDDPETVWPGTSPNVVSTGGTTVRRDRVVGKYLEEVPWDLTSGGTSIYEARPSYQDPISALVGTSRGTPDVAFISNPVTGFWVLDSNQGGWNIVGGTSVSAAGVAGIINLAGNFYSSSAAELSVIYTNRDNAAAFHDIRWGYNGSYGGYTAARSWDFCSGVGSPLTLVGK